MYGENFEIQEGFWDE